MELTLDVLQAARFLHLHPATLREKARRGEVPAAKIGKQWIFLQVDLEAYVRSQYAPRMSQGESKEKSGCHSTDAKTHPIGGSNSKYWEGKYNAALAQATKPKPRSTTPG